MNRFGVTDEGEVMSGFVLKFYRQHMKGRRDFDGRQQLMIYVNGLVRWARGQFVEAVKQDREGDPDAWLRVASAWYWSCYHVDAANALGFVSMPWVAAHEHLIHIQRLCARAY